MVALLVEGEGARCLLVTSKRTLTFFLPLFRAIRRQHQAQLAVDPFLNLAMVVYFEFVVMWSL